MKWIRDAFKGPLVVKGVQNREDARRAIDCGASGVVVSTPRGRSLRPGRPFCYGNPAHASFTFSRLHTRHADG
jgi:L-lactate dehydrogenase (cytochrome)